MEKYWNHSHTGNESEIDFDQFKLVLMTLQHPDVLTEIMAAGDSFSKKVRTWEAADHEEE